VATKAKSGKKPAAQKAAFKRSSGGRFETGPPASADLAEPAGLLPGEGFVNAYPLLMVGDGGAVVAELAHLLALAGYDNAIARGESEPVLDDDLMRLVIEFQQANGIDPWKATSKERGANPPILSSNQSGVVDAYTWAALLGGAPELTRADLVAAAYATEGKRT
jgi:hypothetical protein